MDLKEILLALLAITALIGVVAIHFHLTTLASLMTDAKNLASDVKDLLHTKPTVTPAAAPASTVTHTVTFNGVQPVATPAVVPAPATATGATAPRTPSPLLGADWPANTGASNTLVPPSKFPSYTQGDPIQGYADAQQEYKTYTPDQVNSLMGEFAAQTPVTMAWKEDGPVGRGPYYL